MSDNAWRVNSTKSVVLKLYRGIGIPAALQDSIFERFRRVESPARTPVSGTGLGLSIARDLAQLNGGELLLARSSPGDGTSLELQLPLASG